MKVARFENFNVGDKVESFDSAGYYVMQYCGIIVDISKDKKDAIIRSFEGACYSTVSLRGDRISEVSELK